MTYSPGNKIDPTGVGRVPGPTERGEIRRELAEEIGRDGADLGAAEQPTDLTAPANGLAIAVVRPHGTATGGGDGARGVILRLASNDYRVFHDAAGNRPRRGLEPRGWVSRYDSVDERYPWSWRIHFGYVYNHRLME